jgi:hypothetical protein
MSTPQGSGETVSEYKARILGYQAGADALVLQAKAPDTLASLIDGLTADVTESLALYRALRRANLKLLRSLTDEEWGRSGVHAERGVESLRNIAMYIAGHDIYHFRQIESILRSLGKRTPKTSAAEPEHEAAES